MEKENLLIEQYELIKEVHFVFENVEPKIIGKIFKIIKGADAEYMWEINYYCRLSEEAEAYTPSAPFANNLEDIYNLLLNYIKRFEKAVDWRVNKYFN